MSFFSAGNIGYSVLRGLRDIGPYWTVHGGTSLVYHLNHREPGDIDFFCEHLAWDDGVAPFTADRIIPSHWPNAAELKAQAVAGWLDPRLGTFKLHFEKITLAFIRYPRVTGTIARVYPPGMLPLASLQDVVALKVRVLAYRRSIVDYRDWVAILTRSGLSIEEIVGAAQLCSAMYPGKTDLETCFWLLSEMPLDAQNCLTPEEIHLLKEASRKACDLVRGRFLSSPGASS